MVNGKQKKELPVLPVIFWWKSNCSNKYEENTAQKQLNKYVSACISAVHTYVFAKWSIVEVL